MKSGPATSARLLSLLLLLFCLAASQAFAAPGVPTADARFAPFGPGNGVMAVAFDPGSGVLYAGFHLGGVYRSADQGRSWTWSGQGLGHRMIQVLAVAAPGEIYAATKLDKRLEVLGSFDHGATWSVLGSVPSPDSLFLRQGALVAGGEPGVLYFAVSRELWKSSDRGRTWTRLLQSKSWFNKVFALQGSREVYAGTADPGARVLRSADAGETWTEIYPPAPGAVTGLAVTPGAAGRPAAIYLGVGWNGLFVSKDGGRLWGQADQPYAGFELSAITVDATNPDLVYAAYRASRSEPFQVRVGLEGTTWWPAGLLMGDAPPTWGVDFLSTPGTLYAFSEIDLAASTDRGWSWSYRLRGGVGTSHVFSQIRFVPDDPATVYALVGERAFKSQDGGRSWGSFATSFMQWGKTELRDLVVDSARPSTLYAAGDLGVFQSTDRGDHWRLVGPPARRLAVLSGKTLLAGGCGVTRSPDAGATWRETLACQADDGRERKIEKLLLHPKKPDTVYAAVAEEKSGEEAVYRIYRSRDDGRTWKSILSDSAVLALSPRRPVTLYAVQGDDLLLASRDGGDTFREIGRLGLRRLRPIGPVSDLLVDRRNPATLYVATRDHGLRRSTDGGATWAELKARNAPHSENQAPQYVAGITADPVRPGVFYLSYLGGGSLLRMEDP
jgi:photosystem II stability/assembly factor-like uncharacterized protein